VGANFTTSNLDHKFILKEWLDVNKIFNFERYRAYYDMTDMDMLLDQALKMAKEIVAPTYDESEANPLRLVNGKVKVSQCFRSAFQVLNEKGWGVSNGNENEAGKLPNVVLAACEEFLTGANPALNQLVHITKSATGLIQSFGNDYVKNLFLPKMFCGEWAGTVCLTETGGGSDVGDLLSKAYPTDDPKVYQIKGTKCFISQGDHDVTENIVHLVLARVNGAAPGTKGISLFAVPKYWPNEDGSVGKWNDVTTVALEHKMGWKGSPTAMLNFGDNGECQGILLGAAPDQNGVGQGMAQMFQVVNDARVYTGLVALSITSVAYHNAVQYAKQRVQGRPFSHQGNNTPRVRIIEHEDVRRMLMVQKATLEAMRALVFETYYNFDVAFYSDDPAEKRIAQRRIEVNTPLIKAYCSDAAWQLTAEAIQVYGGYGYSEEYPVAHSARDVKILSIFEGTNYIQSKDLLERKWKLDNGAVFREWMQDIEDFISVNEKNEDFSKELAILKNAFNAYQEMQVFVLRSMEYNPRLVPLYSTRILQSTAIMYCGKLLLSQGLLVNQKLVALKQKDNHYAFYKGKTECVKYYLHNIVPSVILTKDIVMDADTSAIDISEEVF
jgi:alkylation response protein AidB-like acyl-CoA dehydrogenase